MLTDVFDKVKADDLMVTDPSSSMTIIHAFGGEHLATNDRPPRIVWVPSNDSFAKGKVTSSYGSPAYDRTKRSTGTRFCGVRIEIWGQAASSPTPTGKDHHKATEVLMHRLLSVLHRQFFGSFRVESAVWEGQDGSALGQFGRKVTLSCVYEVPIADPADLWDRATITATEQTPVVESGTLGEP